MSRSSWTSPPGPGSAPRRPAGRTPWRAAGRPGRRSGRTSARGRCGCASQARLRRSPPCRGTGSPAPYASAARSRPPAFGDHPLLHQPATSVVMHTAGSIVTLEEEADRQLSPGCGPGTGWTARRPANHLDRPRPSAAGHDPAGRPAQGREELAQPEHRSRRSRRWSGPRRPPGRRAAAGRPHREGLGESGGVAGEDALRIEHEPEAPGVGELAEVDEQVVLGLENAGQAGRSWSHYERASGQPAAQVDRVVGLVVPGEGRACLGCSTAPAGGLEKVIVTTWGSDARERRCWTCS
jgi:hypothetical protein